MAYDVHKIRNLTLTGHSGAGKTSLAEAINFNCGKANRLGRIEDGTTVSDYDKDEIERKISLKMALVSGDWQNTHFNIIDTPGYADFIAEAKAALRVVDGSVVVMNAGSPVEIGTERVWAFAEDMQLPRMLFVNKTDRPELDLDSALTVVQECFGRQVVPLQLPVNPGEGFNQIVDLVNMQLLTYADGKAQSGKVPEDVQDDVNALREQLVEAVAETDEELMEKYFSEGVLSTDELERGLRQAVLKREVFPLYYGDSYNNVGVDQLLHAAATYMPTPAESPGLQIQDRNSKDIVLEASLQAPLAALVFKTISEQHVGDLTLLRIYAGTLKPGADVYNANESNNERIGQMFELTGHQRTEVAEGTAGDIVALVKLKGTHSGNTLCDRSNRLTLPFIKYPEPLIRVAISAKDKGGEDRMGSGFAQLHEEDLSFTFAYDAEIRQSILLTQGDIHLDTIIKRLKERFGVEVNLETPKIPYRETIRSNAEGHHRHKKQSGGRGQFGEVFLRINPRGRGEDCAFDNAVVGGTIPGNFIPAVEKGVSETLVIGPLAGYTVVDVGSTVYDGKHHPVDSDEVSFKLAASQAFKDAFLKAKPVLLEPIYRLTVTVPEEYMGDVMGDLSSRRGRINGMDSEGHFQIINAEAPLAEIDRYATSLRSMTHGKGMHVQEFDRYEEVPGEIMQKVIEEAQKEKETA
ncbi:MAG: elongation factor G [Candidatus Latescibacteria bacterium]|nr:elongation factor G [Candidatus Latescibacterota bacterium]